MNSILNILLMMPPQEGGDGKTDYSMLLVFGLIFVVFYFFMIRPQQKKQKELNNFRNSLAKGDKVITTGGIYGKISEVNDNSITVEIAKDVKIKVDKSAVLKDPADMPQQK